MLWCAMSEWCWPCINDVCDTFMLALYVGVGFMSSSFEAPDGMMYPCSEVSISLLPVVVAGAETRSSFLIL